MVIAGSASPACWSLVTRRPGANFLALLAAWLAARGESLAAEVTAAVAAPIVIPPAYAALGDWDEDGEAFVYRDGRTDRGASDASRAGNAGSWRR